MENEENNTFRICFTVFCNDRYRDHFYNICFACVQEIEDAPVGISAGVFLFFNAKRAAVGGMVVV